MKSNPVINNNSSLKILNKFILAQSNVNATLKAEVTALKLRVKKLEASKQNQQ